MNKSKIPKYCRQSTKSGEIAYVKIKGQKYYLGKYGSLESKQRYARLIAERDVAGGLKVYEPDTALAGISFGDVFFGGANPSAQGGKIRG